MTRLHHARPGTAPRPARLPARPAQAIEARPADDRTPLRVVSRPFARPRCRTVARDAARRSLVTMLAFAAAMVAALVPSAAARAQAAATFPDKPIQIIVPYAAGGAVGVLARQVGEKLTARWGQPVVVENRPGGGTIIGVDAVARAPADGTTIAVVASTHVTLPLLYDKVPFDPIADFVAVTPLASGEQVLLVHPGIPAQDLRGFIDWARGQGDKLNYASSGGGSPTNLAGEQFKLMTKLPITHVAYKGAAPAITDLIGGQVQLSFQNLQVALPHIRANRVRALAISGEQRSAALPDVPTFAEAGLPGFEARFWFGVLAPKGTPAPIVAKLAEGLAAAVASPDLADSLRQQGLEPFTLTPAAFAAQLVHDRDAYAKTIKAGNIRIN